MPAARELGIRLIKVERGWRRMGVYMLEKIDRAARLVFVVGAGVRDWELEDIEREFFQCNVW